MKFLLYNTEPFITVNATAEYIVVSTKAFFFDGNPAEISNINMYASLLIYSFFKICSLIEYLDADLLMSKSNIFIIIPPLSLTTESESQIAN